MTSFAFILGVAPLVIASGAGAGSRHSLGTGVFAGMLFATSIGIFFIPLFFRLIRRARRPPAAASGRGGRAAPFAGVPGGPMSPASLDAGSGAPGCRMRRRALLSSGAGVPARDEGGRGPLERQRRRVLRLARRGAGARHARRPRPRSFPPSR